MNIRKALMLNSVRVPFLLEPGSPRAVTVFHPYCNGVTPRTVNASHPYCEVMGMFG